MRYMGDTGPAPLPPVAPLSKPAPAGPPAARFAGKLTRAELVALMAAAPPAASQLAPEDVQFAIENADVLRDDYAEPLVAFASATGPGKSKRLLLLGIGALVGLAVGAVAVKVLG